MTDEVQQDAQAEPQDDAPTGDATGQQETAEPQAEPTFSKAEVERIVKDRLERERKKAEEAAAKAAAEAERKAAEEQGEYKKLYEKLQSELDAERNARRDMELANMRRDVAAKYNLPAQIAERLRGETAEDMEDDAKILAEALPKAPAPNINAGSGNGATPKTGGMTEADAQEFAAIYGLSLDSVKAVIGG